MNKIYVSLLLLTTGVLTCRSMSMIDDSNIWIVADGWEGITSGLIYDTVTGSSTLRPDNFGYSPYWSPATASCQMKIFTSLGQSMTLWDSVTENNTTLDNLLVTGRTAHSMNCVNNGQDLLICGGQRRDGLLKSCELCHMTLSIPLCVPISGMPFPRMTHASVTVNESTLLIIGGSGSLGGYVNTVFSYDIETDSWNNDLPEMHRPRGDWPGAAMLDANRLLVCGGSGSTSHPEVFASCEIFDFSVPSKGWTYFQSMQHSRSYFGMIRMANGIYALGGYDGNDANSWLSSVEVYDTDSMKWSYAKNMSQHMTPYTAVRLQ